jgi:hypothetical protein
LLVSVTSTEWRPASSTLWAMHGMLSAAILIGCFAVIAAAAVIAAVRIYRGDHRDGSRA